MGGPHEATKAETVWALPTGVLCGMLAKEKSLRQVTLAAEDMAQSAAWC